MSSRHCNGDEAEAMTPAPSMPKIHGIICPLAAPLLDGGGIGDEGVRELLNSILPALDGVFVNGSSGEFTSLLDSEAEQIASETVRTVAKRAPVYCGVGDTSSRRSAERLRRLEQTGIDFAVATLPFYYPLSDAAVVAYFEDLADLAEVPLLLYNIPQNTQSVLRPPAVAELSLHPNIVGIKDSGGDLFAFQQFVLLRSSGFAVLQGREQLAAVSVFLGADGICSAVANFAAPLLRAVWLAAANGHRRDEALRLQAKLDRLAELFEHGFWLSALKTALALCGFDVGDPSAPLPASTEPERAAISTCLEEARGWLTILPP